MKTLAARAVAELTEDEWQRQVIELARMLGWKCAHFRPAKTSKGWRTAVQGDGAGWPDLVLVKDRVLYVELKRTKGKLTKEQQDWQEWLQAAGASVHVWRPEDLQEAADTLTGTKGGASVR